MPSSLSADREKPRYRERFASPFIVLLVVGSGLAMLVAMYPEKEIINMFGMDREPSPAVQRYLEALVRIRPEDPLLRIELARIYVRVGCPSRAIEITGPLDRKKLTADDWKRVESLRYQAALQDLYFVSPEEPAWKVSQSYYAAQVDSRIKGGAGRTELGAILADAEMVGDMQTVRRIEALIGSAGPQGMKSGDMEADRAAGIPLASGDYRGAASAYLSFIPKRQALHEKRRLFTAALSALQSGNQLHEALRLAESQIGVLADDRETLVFVTRLALAANRPEVAQKYVRKALGMRQAKAGG